MEDNLHYIFYFMGLVGIVCWIVIRYFRLVGNVREEIQKGTNNIEEYKSRIKELKQEHKKVEPEYNKVAGKLIKKREERDKLQEEYNALLENSSTSTYDELTSRDNRKVER